MGTMNIFDTPIHRRIHKLADTSSKRLKSLQEQFKDVSLEGSVLLDDPKDPVDIAIEHEELGAEIQDEAYYLNILEETETQKDPWAFINSKIKDFELMLPLLVESPQAREIIKKALTTYQKIRDGIQDLAPEGEELEREE